VWQAEPVKVASDAELWRWDARPTETWPPHPTPDRRSQVTHAPTLTGATMSHPARKSAVLRA